MYHLQKSSALNLDVGVQGQSLDGDTSEKTRTVSSILFILNMPRATPADLQAKAIRDVTMIFFLSQTPTTMLHPIAGRLCVYEG